MNPLQTKQAIKVWLARHGSGCPSADTPDLLAIIKPEGKVYLEESQAKDSSGTTPSAHPVPPTQVVRGGFVRSQGTGVRNSGFSVSAFRLGTVWHGLARVLARVTGGMGGGGAKAEG